MEQTVWIAKRLPNFVRRSQYLTVVLGAAVNPIVVVGAVSNVLRHSCQSPDINRQIKILVTVDIQAEHFLAGIRAIL